jgi:alkaline phosphatase D
MRFKGDRNRIYEDYRLGKTVDLMLTDERQYRDQQPCNDAIIVPCPDSTAPGRTLLGAKQKQWLLESLEASPATWKVWGTQLMLMGLRTGAVPEATAQVDAWDGYAAERREILDRLIDRNVSNIVAITGDIHTFFAGTATTTGDKTAGNRDAFPEFVGGAATSDGLPEQTDIPAATLELLAPFNGHLDFYEFTKKGYGVVEANSSGLTCELKAVDHHTRGNAATTTLVKYRVAPGARVPERIA